MHECRRSGGKRRANSREWHGRMPLAKVLKLRPELRPRLARAIAHENVGMILALLVLNTVGIAVVPGQFARRKRKNRRAKARPLQGNKFIRGAGPYFQDGVHFASE